MAAPRSSNHVGVVLTLLVAGGLLAGCTAAPVVAPPADGTPGPVTTDGPPAPEDLFTIVVGDCLNDATASETGAVPKVDCSEPHDSEAYFSGDLTGDAYPGDDSIFQGAEAICGPAFTDFVGIAYQEGVGYDYSYYKPTEASWNEGDREIMCVAFDPSGAQVTGSLKGRKDN